MWLLLLPHCVAELAMMCCLMLHVLLAVARNFYEALPSSQRSGARAGCHNGKDTACCCWWCVDSLSLCAWTAEDVQSMSKDDIHL
jgi:hypothetical protein